MEFSVLICGSPISNIVCLQKVHAWSKSLLLAMLVVWKLDTENLLNFCCNLDFDSWQIFAGIFWHSGALWFCFSFILNGVKIHAHKCVSIDSMQKMSELTIFVNFLSYFHQVPQQKNEYDCGLFVLYFMERFIEGAPERLKSKDLAMVKNLVPFVFKTNSHFFTWLIS